MTKRVLNQVQLIILTVVTEDRIYQILPMWGAATAAYSPRRLLDF